jgi:hypothetical protein
MSLGLSLFAIAVGAILKFAVKASVAGIDIGTVILIAAGAGGPATWLGLAIATGGSTDSRV